MPDYTLQHLRNENELARENAELRARAKKLETEIADIKATRPRLKPLEVHIDGVFVRCENVRIEMPLPGDRRLRIFVDEEGSALIGYTNGSMDFDKRTTHIDAFNHFSNYRDKPEPKTVNGMELREWFLHAYGSNELLESGEVPVWGRFAFEAEEMRNASKTFATKVPEGGALAFFESVAPLVSPDPDDSSFFNVVVPWKPGDRVFWTDPANGEGSRVYNIGTISVCGDIITITETEGSTLECYIDELCTVDENGCVSVQFVPMANTPNGDPIVVPTPCGAPDRFLVRASKMVGLQPKTPKAQNLLHRGIHVSEWMHAWAFAHPFEIKW